MKLSQAIGAAQSRKPCAFTYEEMTWWINQLEARVWAEVWGLPELFRKPYNYAEDANAELFVHSPHDDIYEAFLEYRIDWYNGEYQNASNTEAAFEAVWNSYTADVGNRYDPHGVPRWRQWVDVVKIREGDGADLDIILSINPCLLMEVEVNVITAFSEGTEIVLAAAGEEFRIDAAVPVCSKFIVMRELETNGKVSVSASSGDGNGYAEVKARRMVDKRRYRFGETCNVKGG